MRQTRLPSVNFFQFASPQFLSICFSFLSGGPAAFKISGMVYRRIGSIMAPIGSTNPKYIQVYFYDEQFQRDQRTGQAETQQGHTQGQHHTRTNNKRNILLENTIFARLRNILVNDCRNSFLSSFFAIKEEIDRQGLMAENVLIELIEPNRENAITTLLELLMMQFIQVD
jgi:hypothetical protein